jgi:hypothetical protein
MRTTDTLQLKPRKRGGGGGKTAREYLDFVVSGDSLRDRLGAAAGDLIGCLGWGVPEYHQVAVEQLLLERPTELASGRHMLYVCPECGDIGCGAITGVITREGEDIVWRDFGYENDYDEGISRREDLASLGPFYFDAGQYSAVLRSASCVATPTA